MKKLLALLSLASAPMFGQSYPDAAALTTFDQTWLDNFTATEADRSFIPLDSSEGAPSTRMTVVWDMDDHLEASDEGKTVKEVISGPEWRNIFYGNFLTQPGYPEQADDYLMIENDPYSTRLGIKRTVKANEIVPTMSLYFQLTAAEAPPSGGYQHAAMSVDMYIPTSFDFENSTGKSGVGLNAGTRPANGGSTPPDDQLGAALRVVRGAESQKFIRPYVYNLNRQSDFGWPLYGYQGDYSGNAPQPQGEWVRYEIEYYINDLGSKNGYVKLWANGTKFAEYTGLEMYTADQPFLVNSMLVQDMWQQDFDGSGLKRPSSTQHYWYSRIRGMIPGTPSGEDWIADVTSLDYGFNTVSATETLTVNWTNNSGGALSGSVTIGGNNTAHYSIASGSSFTDLSNGSAHTVQVEYTPLGTGSHPSTLDITGGDGDSINLAGYAATLQAGLTDIDATTGTLISPMVADGGGTYISTPTNDDGEAIFAVTISTAGLYEISANVNAPSISDNSFFVGFNDTTLNATDIWDIVELTTGFENRLMNIRGTGSFDVPEFKPATVNLSTGTNYIIFAGRENDTQLQDFSLTLIGDADLMFKVSPSAPTASLTGL